LGKSGEIIRALPPDSDQPFAPLLAKIIEIAGLDIRIGDRDPQEILEKL
jgi:hypothetical protein